MKSFLILTLLTAQALWLFRPLVPYVEYALNQEFIAEVLCINKVQPQLECDGKCYLRARIQEESQPQPEGPGVIPIAPEWDQLFAVSVVAVPPAFSDQPFSVSPQDAPVLFREVIISVPTPPPQIAG